MLCQRCDGKGQVLNQIVIFEEIVGRDNDVIEHTEEYDILEHCPDCTQQWIAYND